MLKCTKCHTENPDNQLYCKRCKEPLNPYEETICSNCKKVVGPFAKKCRHCGTKIIKVEHHMEVQNKYTEAKSNIIDFRTVKRKKMKKSVQKKLNKTNVVAFIIVVLIIIGVVGQIVK